VANNTNINKIITKKRILVAPLDWGLGHTTRCIPIIKAFITSGFEVILAAEKAGNALLIKEFPTLKILPLKGYNIGYSKNSRMLLLKLIMQFPKIHAAIKNENLWLDNVIKEYKIDIVLSDNRFGLYNKNAHCIFITHQLNIKTGNSFTEKLAQKINYFFINKFNECWIPDEAGRENFAGELAHPIILPKIPITYIGGLSRFKKIDTTKKIDLLVLLSGPEPQRTIFEKIIIGQMKGSVLKIALVRGLPMAENNIEVEGVETYNHLLAEDLNKLILESTIIIARSGYTTVMDLSKLQKKAIFVPTSRQTEQEYLASYLSEKNYCTYENQISFDLQAALNKINNANLIPYPVLENNNLTERINSLL
jgi:uncharacterized protein (TIGR00661 family)